MTPDSFETPPDPAALSFAEPWQARAYGVGLELIRSQGSWEAFRTVLMAAIAAEPDRPYFESWVIALERFAEYSGVSSASELEAERAESATYHYHDEQGEIEVTPLVTVAFAAVADLVEVERAGQVELYRRVGDGDSAEFGIRTFTTDGAALQDRALSGDDWQARLTMVLSWSPVSG